MNRIIIFIYIMLVSACSIHIDVGGDLGRKKHYKKKGKHKKNDTKCNDFCHIYKYDWEFNDLIEDYDHPWCLCMSQCMENGHYCDEKFPDGFKKKDHKYKEKN